MGKSLSPRVITESPMSQQMEQAIYFPTMDQMEEIVRSRSLPSSRLYLGSEFCPELLPTPEELHRAVLITRDANLALTLCTPPATEKYLPHVLALADFLAAREPEAEIVVNDWGVLRALHPYPLSLSAGRTFQKNKRDSRIATLWPGLSPAMREFYRGNNVLQPSFLAFLKKFRITRMEIDLPPWGIDPQLLREAALPISLHAPYTYVTTSHVCPTLAAVAPSAGKDGSERRCPRPCLANTLTLSNPVFATPLLLRGNTYFIESRDAWDAGILAGSAVDRVVWAGPKEGCQ